MSEENSVKKTDGAAKAAKPKKEESFRFRKLGKAVKNLKGGRWGRWDDLITEMDGQEAEGHL